MITPLRSIILAALVMLTLESSGKASSTIMPLGDSITVGVDFFTDSAGGYRDPLYRDLTATGVSFSFVGASNASSTSELTASGNAYHNGFSGYRIDQIQTNLNGNSGDSGNLGGYWLTGGNGTGRGAVTPNIVLL
ncbi:MAG: hypothetical protein LV480_04230, partial [Methylacidiphilales bacterium]|nr:hypothetical protein [Candidatus Methylacidiphilales bacterium]